MSNQTKHNHYLPRCYLKQWKTDSLIKYSYYDSVRGVFTTKQSIRETKNLDKTGSIEYFYSQDLETYLAKKYDNKFADYKQNDFQVITNYNDLIKISINKELSKKQEEEKNNIIKILLLQFVVRSPLYFDYLLKKDIQDKIKPYAEPQTLWGQILIDSSYSQRSLWSGQHKIANNMSKDYFEFILNEINTVGNIIIIDTTSDLPTCDNPFTSFPGFQNIYMFPLTPKKLAVFGNGFIDQKNINTIKTVQEGVIINHLTEKYENFIISKQDFNDYEPKIYYK